MTIKIRDYQKELIDETREAFKDNNSVVMQSPTGSGKTLTTAWIVQSVLQNGKRCIFCVHRMELVSQTSLAFGKLGIEHGFITSNTDYDETKLVHIAGIDTLRRRLDEVVPPDLLICDEGHRYMAGSYKKVVDYWPNAKKLIITATPERLDGRGLKHIAQKLVVGKTPRWLIDNGFLSPYRVFAPNTPDLTGIKTTGGDYQIDQLATAMNTSSITGNALEHYIKHCDGMQAIVFAVNIEHSKSIVAQFMEAGIPSAHLDGTFGKIEREDVVERFKYGETRILSNVNILTEGFDISGIQAAILLRPTKSLALFLQMVGRALRPVYNEGADLETLKTRLSAQTKIAIILDHAGNCKTHGLPAIERHWSLEGKKGRKKSDIINSTCEKCFHVWERKPKEPIKCPLCGWEPEKKEKKTGEYTAGDLEEIIEKPNEFAWAKNKSFSVIKERVKTHRDLVEIAKVRGYKPGWAFFKAKEWGIIK